MKNLILYVSFAILLFSCSKENSTDHYIDPVVVSDIEGNTYKTVVIGSQTWFAENLKATKFKDGSIIPMVTDNIAWKNLKTPGYCWYNNNQDNKGTYGALYNWFSVETGKLCPSGWHVPTDSEWSILTTYLGGINSDILLNITGGKLKESGLVHWKSPNKGATNEYGFNGLPAGDRNGTYGNFDYLGTGCIWWTSNSFDMDSAWFRYLNYEDGGVSRTYDTKSGGFSVRCIKD